MTEMAATLTSDCVSCVVVGLLEHTTQTVMRDFFIGASNAVFTVAGSFLTVWVLWKLTEALFGKGFDQAALLSLVLRSAIVMGLTAQPDEMFALFTAFGAAAPYFAGIVVSGSPADDITILLRQTEHTFTSDLGAKMTEMWRDVSIFDAAGFLAVCVFSIPLLMLGWQMLRNLFLPLMTVFGIGMLLPFLSAFVIFERTLPIVGNAIKIMVSAVFSLVLATATVALTIQVMGQVVDMITDASSVPLFSTLFWSVIITTLLLSLVFQVIMQLPHAVLQIVMGGGGGGGGGGLVQSMATGAVMGRMMRR